MKALVTGGAGFIGSHLCGALSKSCCVVAVDDLSNESSQRRLDVLASNGVEFVRGDVRNGELMMELMNGIDVVYHLAALNSVPRSLVIPMKVHDVNTRGTLSVLLAARDNGVDRVVFASSSSVYGDMACARREDMICNPCSPYGASKLAGEAYCNAMFQSFGLSTVCLRYFNIYGERQACNSEYAAVVPHFIKALRNGSRPLIYGDGTQVRGFTFIDDAVRGTVLAGESQVNGVFNIGSESGHSVRKLLDILCGITGRRAEPEYASARKGDVAFSVASVEKAKVFGYKPEWHLQSGLERLVKNWEEY